MWWAESDTHSVVSEVQNLAAVWEPLAKCTMKSSFRTPLCMMLTEKGPNYVYSGNAGLQVSYLAMWACEHFVSVSALCPGSQLTASTSSRPVTAAKKSFLEIVTTIYKIFPWWELKAWNLLLQVIGSHLFPNDMKIFMLWLKSFHEINSILFLCIYQMWMNEWHSPTAFCFVEDTWTQTQENSTLYYDISDVVNVWHNFGMSKEKCCKNETSNSKCFIQNLDFHL